MNPRQWTDNEIIRGIRDEKTRDRTLYAIFHRLDWRGSAIAFVIQQGGSLEEGEEIAQDAFVFFDRNIRNDRFLEGSALKTYFLAIVKRQWWKRLERRPQADLPLDEKRHDAEADSVEVMYISAERKRAFTEVLAQIGERCKRIFELTMLESTMDEIARALQLSSAEMAKKEAYRCRIRLREFLEINPIWKNRLR